jgi:beta-N-acetylhexosaminidase
MKKLFSFIMIILLMTSMGIPHTQAEQKTINFHPASENEKREEVAQIIADMNDREKIGQLVMAANDHADNGMPNEFMRQMIQEYHVGSVIVYGKRDAVSQAAYNNKVQEYAADTRLNIPLFTSADLENGAAQRVPDDATTLPRQMGVGATHSLTAADEYAKIAAKEVKALGFNWSYSPVADVNNNPLNPVIGVRSFSGNTALASEMTATQVARYQEEGVIATAKHFPGHGDTETDSHYGLPIVTYDREVLDEVHLPPFQAAIDEGIDSIMTSHIIIEAIDPELPATLSEDVLTGLLREEMGFDGLIVTDAMEMQAITDNWGTGEAAVMAIQAGADIIMAVGSQAAQLETLDALYDAYQSGELTEERVQESLERILMKKFEYGLFDQRYVDPEEAAAFVGNQDHRNAADQLARDSITVVKNEGILPFDEDSEETTFVAGVTEVNAIADRAQQRSSGNVVSWQANSNNPSSEEIEEAVAQAEEADRILIATFAIAELPEGQRNLVQALRETGKPTAAVSVGLPYDLQSYPEVDAYMASYALDNWQLANPTTINAAVDVVFGEEPGGKLPVTIEGQYPFGHGLSYAPKSAADMQNLLTQYAEAGAFENDEAVRSLEIHLIAVGQFENQGNGDKVVRHMEGFKMLLNHQLDHNSISLEAFNSLQNHADALIGQWE